MVNSKKLEFAFRRYSKNFVEGIKFEDVKSDYEEIQDEINSIIDKNSTENDHILLIDLDSIFSYYLSKWKNAVLINQGNRAEDLKKMQMVVFYQCMAQDLYKERYPNMMAEYTFVDVITALVHFTMYGWEKEEVEFFGFIEKHLGSPFLSANDCNRHTWFLLELYLQYRDKTIFQTKSNVYPAVMGELQRSGLRYDLIPENLDIYDEVLAHWSTSDLGEIEALIRKMIEYHSNFASELGQSIEFGDFRYAFYPYEILFLLYVRKQRGLPNPESFDDFLMSTPEANMKIRDPEPYPEWDPLLRQIDHFYRKNYLEYTPNKLGNLFE